MVAGADEVSDPHALAALVQRYQVSHLLAVPALYELILEHAPKVALESLRVAIVAGESCPSGLPSRHADALPHVAFFNEYGPTETSVWATVERCEAGLAHNAPVSIGRPIPGTRVHVLDHRLHETPIGVTGELYIGGAGVARGYLGRPELTAQRFVADSFATEPGMRLYRTGDLARWRADGRLDCLGRIDGQVKIRGHRVELGEVEAAVASHPGVREAAVTTIVDAKGEMRLAAYLVARTGETLTVGSLRAWLKARLPDALVPSSFAVLDESPRSPHGKVDRAALPDPSASRLAPACAEDAPRNQVEQNARELAADLLAVPIVGVDDDLFELGFDSIRAIQLAAQSADARSDVDPGPDLSVADDCRSRRRRCHGRAASPMQTQEHDVSTDYEHVYALTPLQQGMLLHSRLDPRSGAYVQQLLASIQGTVDAVALEDAWNALADRHDVLRTSFHWDGPDGEPLQTVHRQVRMPLNVFDWRGLDREQQRTRLDDYLASDRRQGFDPGVAPCRASRFSG